MKSLIGLTIVFFLVAMGLSHHIGYQHGLRGKGAFKVIYYDKYFPVSNSFLVFNHDASWDSFSIQEKMFLCAYGSSGNKFSHKDIEEIQKRWGPQ